MAGYLGATPVPQATQHRESFTATAGQTTFATAGYTVGFVDVYLNGVHLTPADVTATNGSDVVLGACLVNDIVDVISHSAFEVNNGVFTGSATFNEGSADADFRVESNGNANMLFVDGGNNRVGIGMNDPTASLDVDLGFIQVNTAGTASGRFGSSTYITTGADSNLVVQAVVSGASTQFYQGSVLAQTIDSTGAITKPLQPAFLAQPASTQTNIAINSHVEVVFGTERFDQNADFASNTFTAPVTGKYQLNTSIRIENWDISASYYQLIVETSNRNYISTWDAALHASADHDFITLNIPCLADMDASDTAIVTLRQQGGAAQADIQSETFFSGFLAC